MGGVTKVLGIIWDSNKDMLKFDLSKIAKGDIVQVHEEKMKQGQWKLGVIKDLIMGRDGQVRGASVRVISKGKPQILSRPLKKLYPLEITGTDLENGMEMTECKRNEIGEKICIEKQKEWGTRPLRPQRAAARDAQWKSRLMLDP